ncbi:MAG: DMT family transporter [Acidobacteria bacterium]|nr:DMT family transporter [Acidobacteriota bacterium]
MEQYVGELAAVATACCWSFGSLMFTFAGRRVGSYTVNNTRLWLAFLFLLVLHWLMFGLLYPVDAAGYRFLWLGLSGLVGYVFGDGMLFEAFVRIGPRLSMLLMTLVPVIGAFLGWLVLGEALRPVEWLAIAVTLTGIALVVSDRRNGSAFAPGQKWSGVLFGIGGAVGQAGGLLLAKLGLDGGFSAVSANLIRVSTAALAMGFLVGVRGHLPMQWRRLADRPALALITGASLLGPVLGVILSLVAIANAPIGIAATLMSLSPVLLLPLSRWFFHETITARAVGGTLVALGGAALFFLFE